jgi:ribosomal-protein-alanine N-acetyltransferase
LNALWKAPAAGPGPRLTTMTIADLDEVMAVETHAYAFPWTRGNFIDSLAAGYVACLLRVGDSPALVGYFIAMEGAAEMHLLNITVDAPYRRRGHARFMIEALAERCRRDAAERLWLEVRESNAAARLAYARLGFAERGLRTGYYPAARGQRESAVVMSRIISPEGTEAVDPGGASDALD